MDDFSERISPADWSGDPAVEPQRTPLPTLLQVICVVAILLGISGGLAAMLRGAVLIKGVSAQTKLDPASDKLSAEARELHNRMQEEINATARRYVVWSVVLVVLHMGSALLLLIGGLLSLQRKNLGCRLLLLACGVATFYAVGNTVVDALIQWEAIPLVRQFMGEMVGEVVRESVDTAEQADESQLVVEMTPRLVMAAIYVGLAVSAMLLLLKLVFYTWVVVYLRRPRVRAFFGRDLARAEIA